MTGIRIAVVTGGAALLAAASPPTPLTMAVGAATAGEARRASISVELDGLRSHKGQVLACLTANPRDFPDCTKDPDARHLAVPANGNGLIVFHDVAPGRYAISLFHDENGNGKLDKLMMMPREGFGFSRNAPVRFGPPSFGAAAFDVGGASVREEVRIRYML